MAINVDKAVTLISAILEEDTYGDHRVDAIEIVVEEVFAAGAGSVSDRSVTSGSRTF